MTFFLTLVLKILPLYINILLGFVAGRFLDAQRETISKIIFYIISPLVIFSSVMRTELSASALSLPLLTFSIATFISLIIYPLAAKIWDDSTVNITAFSAGTGNTGYFGLPLAILLLSEQAEGIYIMCLFGIVLYESGTGFFLLAKGSHSKEEIFRKLIRLPQIYAFLLGLTLNLFEIKIPVVFNEYLVNIKGAYSILGMMLIGLSIAKMSDFRLDRQFIGMVFFAKFAVWPITVMTVLFFDHLLFSFYSDSAHQALILLSIVPLAVNMVVMSQLLDIQPSKAASAVLLSTIFALFYAPIMCYFFLG